MHSGYTFSLVCVFPGNRTHNLLRCLRNALPLSHTGTQYYTLYNWGLHYQTLNITNRYEQNTIVSSCVVDNSRCHACNTSRHQQWRSSMLKKIPIVHDEYEFVTLANRNTWVPSYMLSNNPKRNRNNVSVLLGGILQWRKCLLSYGNNNPA